MPKFPCRQRGSLGQPNHLLLHMVRQTKTKVSLCIALYQYIPTLCEGQQQTYFLKLSYPYKIDWSPRHWVISTTSQWSEMFWHDIDACFYISIMKSLPNLFFNISDVVQYSFWLARLILTRQTYSLGNGSPPYSIFYFLSSILGLHW